MLERRRVRRRVDAHDAAAPAAVVEVNEVSKLSVPGVAHRLSSPGAGRTTPASLTSSNLGGNGQRVDERRELVLELLRGARAPAVGQVDRHRVGEDLLFTTLDAVEDPLLERL